MIRYTLADMVEDPWGEGTLVPAVAYYPVDFNGAPPVDPVTGALLRNWALVEITRASDNDMTLMQNDQRIDVMPGYPMETPVAAIPAQEVSALRLALERRSIGSTIVDEAPTYGHIVATVSLRANAVNAAPTLEQLTL